MDRYIGIQERPEPEKSRGEKPERRSEPQGREIESRDECLVTGRGFVYFLSESQTNTMAEIGRFRTIDERDIREYRYQKDRDLMRQDLRTLRDQGLVQHKTIWTGHQGERLSVYVLTKRGKALLEKQKPSSDQKIFAGFVKPAEVRHDAAIYRMYQAEAKNIERRGGRIRRVVLDFELKQRVYQPLAKIRAKATSTSQDYMRQQAEIARENRLKVINGKILLPDLRIEFDTASGDRAHVDLELATHHYRGSSLRAKSDAGFKMYAPESSAGGLAAFDPEHISQIFSF